MQPIWIAAAVSAVLAVAVLVAGMAYMRRKARVTHAKAARRADPARARPVSAEVSDTMPAELARPTRPAAAAATAMAPPGPVPGATWTDPDTLTETQAQAIVVTFRDLPRPPHLLSRLVSMDHLDAASSSELADLIVGEPLIAAKVLAAVNAPSYGLTRAVSGIGQAVTYLGLNAVRAICVRYTLMQSFRVDSEDRAARLQMLWQASALAGELTQYPAQRAALPNAGGLTSAVLLSFLGSLAVAAAVPRSQLALLPARDFVARSRAEQALLGLSAAGIGRLLMRQWELPEAIVTEVAGVENTLFAPVRADAAGLRLAFGYLCARLGERMASGELQGLQGLDLHALVDASDDVEMECLRPHLADPGFAALLQALQSAHVAKRVAALLPGRPARTAADARREPALP
jgi:HD-like signal output (HDOD) protein